MKYNNIFIIKNIMDCNKNDLYYTFSNDGKIEYNVYPGPHLIILLHQMKSEHKIIWEIQPFRK